MDFAALVEKVKSEADALIAQYPESRSALLPILHRFQQEQGYVSPEAILQTAEWLNLTPATVESTVTFYSLFYRRPVGKYMLQPCRGLSCIINGAYDIMAYFREKLRLEHLQTSADGLFSYEEVECLASCDRAPCMQVNLEFFYDVTKEKIDAMIEQIRAGRFEVAPLAQTKMPDGSWAGKHAVPGGGVADAVGERMMRRLANNPNPIQARPTSERALSDA
jgi:NADH-quinone oxidoreductase subunit E